MAEQIRIHTLSIRQGRPNIGQHAAVSPGNFIRLFGLSSGEIPFDRIFRLGDRAEFLRGDQPQSGELIRINPLSVSLRNSRGGISHLSLHEFSLLSAHP